MSVFSNADVNADACCDSHSILALSCLLWTGRHLCLHALLAVINMSAQKVFFYNQLFRNNLVFIAIACNANSFAISILVFFSSRPVF